MATQLGSKQVPPGVTLPPVGIPPGVQMSDSKGGVPVHAITHYVGIGLLLDLAFVFVLILIAEMSDNEITPAVVALIGGPVSLATLLIGIISGIALGKQIATSAAKANNHSE